MNKKVIILLFLICPVLSNANDTDPFPEENKGIQIISLSKMNLPNEFKKEISNNLIQQKIKGYKTSNDESISFLLKLPEKAPQEIAEFKNNKNPMDTHLKSNIAEIKLAFNFNKISAIKEEDILGYAAIGSYLKRNKKDLGWSGLRVFFSDKTLGVCSYSLMKIQAVQLTKETIQYLVNNKPSDSIIEGNYTIGFIYSLNWYTNDTMSTLDCANNNFNKNNMKKLIALANKIDKEKINCNYSAHFLATQ